ncbi:hypothetical protein [Candidatus Nitrososphaera sp. FF02]|uniref:glycosyltransferase family protein n=1 Tax=Candidatus Nitrososphaera sp. FF02 TaxID=3398226 RepID=UPI0039E9726E
MNVRDERIFGSGKTVFLVWAPHSARAQGITERTGADLYFMSYKFRSKIYSPIKYPLLFLKSLFLLKDKKPETIVCQAPPIFCPMAAMTYRFLAGRKIGIVVDLHSAALERPWSYLKPLNTAVLKRASAVLVSNREAYDHVLKENNVKSIVLEDRIPRFDPALFPDDEERNGSGYDLEIVVPSSFAYDEPVQEILRAATALPKTRFYLTGDSSKAGNGVLKEQPDNVQFTEYLKADDYARLLHSSDAVMALTTRDRTMLAGAYEAVALQKPLITSNWPPLRRYFNKGTVHVDNTAEGIIAAVQTVKRRKRELEREMGQLREEKTREWETGFMGFRDAVS